MPNSPKLPNAVSFDIHGPQEVQIPRLISSLCRCLTELDIKAAVIFCPTVSLSFSVIRSISDIERDDDVDVDDSWAMERWSGCVPTIIKQES